MTEPEMPVFLEAGYEPAITRVGPCTLTSGGFKVIPSERVPMIGYGRFSTRAIYAFLFNRRIYLVTREKSLDYAGMRKVNVRGILAYPEDAARFTNGQGVSCYSGDDDYYPITDRLVSYMSDIVKRVNIGIMMASVPDRLNNDIDESGTTQQQQPREQ
jgi:hypothetical protein